MEILLSLFFIGVLIFIFRYGADDTRWSYIRYFVSYFKNEYCIKCENIDYLSDDIFELYSCLLIKHDYFNIGNVDLFLDGEEMRLASNRELKDASLWHICELIFSREIFRVLYQKEYLEPLLLKKKQLVYIDEYGDLREDSWNAEVENFCKRKGDDIIATAVMECIVPLGLVSKFDKRLAGFFMLEIELNGKKESLTRSLLPAIVVICVLHYEALKKDEIQRESRDIETPILFEKKIAKKFQECGWKTHTTKQTNDQGADVIAVKDGFKLVLQCKLYSTPVGNKAVQEAISAKIFYEADCAAVVTNSSFTTSAKQLAQSAKVVMLHESNIDKFNEKFDSELKYVL